MMQMGKGKLEMASNYRCRYQPTLGLLVATSVLGFMFVACSSNARTGKEGNSGQSESNSSSEVAITPEARKEAGQIFASRCAVCHGLQGSGNGAGAARLSPTPTNFTDPGWQKSVTDDQIEKVIVYGGAALGKSPAMPANPDLQSDPAVVAALREMIRQMGAQPPAK